MYLKKILNLLIFTSFFSFFNFTISEASTFPKPFNIIPQPQNVEILSGKGLSYGELSGLKIDGDFQRPVMEHILSQLSESGSDRKGTLTIRLIKEETKTVPDSPEGYVLIITGGTAEIRATGKAGLFYGCQTLEQLLEDSRDYNTAIPACKITDYPTLEYRAVHFDIKHHLDHMNQYYKMIDRLARYKINAAIFEFEDKLRYRRRPLVGAPQAISIEEMAALTRYARDRHIEISPLVQGLGHATFILKHKEYAHLRELDWNRWAFCPLDEGTYEVLFDLYLDAMEATPHSKYLHIGGDEIGNIGLCPRCKPTADKEGTLSLNLHWINRVSEFITGHGRTPVFWDDMPLKKADLWETTHSNEFTDSELDEFWEEAQPVLEKVISELPENIIYNRWLYSKAREPGNIRLLDWYRDSGLEVWIATAAQSGPAVLFPFDERNKGMDSRGIPAIKSFIELAAEKDIDGMLCTAWDNRSLHMETYWRGYIASAEYSWNPGCKSLEEYDVAYLQREYGISFKNYSNFYGKLREGAVFWEKAFSREGSRQDSKNALLNLPGISHGAPPVKPEEPGITDFRELLIELPNLKKPGTWSEKYSKRLKQAAYLKENEKAISETLKYFYENSRRNRYHWEVYLALNNFISTPPKLLLALEQCDTSNKKEREKGFENVGTAIREFDKTWENLKSVYGKTRFTELPGIVPDRFYHFASQREDLSYLVQVEELFHEMINDWLEENRIEN